MTISQLIDRAEAAVECEKVMSRHVYYHAGGIHRQEIEEFWVKGEKCTWAHAFGQFGNKSNYILNYADNQERDCREVFDEVVKIYPEIADPKRVPDYRAICEEAMHFTVSPIIEVAEDGQTAKGLFYTPGVIFSTLNPEEAREGMWMWERYGADFVKEDGKWVYQNLKVCPDLSNQMDTPDWPVAPKPRMAPPPPEEGEEAPAPAPKHDVTWPGPLYYSLTPTQTPQEVPFIPVPYRTFAETYDYATLTGIYDNKD